MEHDISSERLIEAWIKRLDLTKLVEWDVLVFLYRHRTSLASADRIASLVGYTSSSVADALDRLESGEIIKRSRASQGARLYRLSSLEGPDSTFHELVKLAQTRSGRMLVDKILRQRSRQNNDYNRLYLVGKGSAKWRKAI